MRIKTQKPFFVIPILKLIKEIENFLKKKFGVKIFTCVHFVSVDSTEKQVQCFLIIMIMHKRLEIISDFGQSVSHVFS